ncbi:hypothetical protein A2Z33_05890 [Candidatus Gottesmanbacteria bacterium RBG_16_52_11]|uniref:Uncharacterized protein n=1 Tax=Candidatus Gottesmanbacteria bacterium RBG_16_52_11 TaxID=1798374 RepID=A0A1F5YXJ8_9BACT|nr:MAG: hypothetical protein A2Z33_05890 [Candidatus Gottesmanbacteria bacterium RBG_16_52_11]
MIYELVPKLYISGVFDTRSGVESFINDVEPETGLERRVLLSRAIQDIQADAGNISMQCQNLGAVEEFCRFSPMEEGGLISPTVIMNTDHPALNFSLSMRKIQRDGGVPLDPQNGLNLLKALIDAQAFIQTHSQDEFVSKQGEFR